MIYNFLVYTNKFKIIKKQIQYLKIILFILEKVHDNKIIDG